MAVAETGTTGVGDEPFDARIFSEFSEPDSRVKFGGSPGASRLSAVQHAEQKLFGSRIVCLLDGQHEVVGVVSVRAGCQDGNSLQYLRPKLNSQTHCLSQVGLLRIPASPAVVIEAFLSTLPVSST